MGQKSIHVEVEFRPSVEQCLLTPLGENLYRMELSRLCADHPDNGDLIECTRLANGNLKFQRIVKRADFEKRSYLISKTVAESEKLARFLERVIALGGNWERNFGGHLVLYLPRSVSFDGVEIKRVCNAAETQEQQD